MRQRRKVMVLVMALLIGGGWVSQAFAQPREGDRGGDRRGGDARRGGDRGRGGTPEDFRARMEEFRKRMQDRMREQFGASEEEWKVLQPRIEKVQNLQRQGRGGFRGFGSRGRGGRGGRGPGGDDRRPEGTPERQRSSIEMKTEALQNLLDDDASSPSAIKAALTALRKAREQSAQELATARKELREVCSMRQEARCVLMGLLD